MKKKKLMKAGIIVIVAVVFLVLVGILSDYYFLKQEHPEENIELDTLFLKVSINVGGSAVNNIRITNVGSRTARFALEIKELENITSLEENEFFLNLGETKDIKVNFNASDIPPGVYLGRLEIISSNQRTIPIILEIQTKEVLFDSQVSLFPPGKDVIAGQKLDVEIKIFDLTNIGTSNIESIYLIKDFEGRTIVSETESLVIENKLSFSKTLDLPIDTKIGNYALINIMEYRNSTGTSSVFFKVIEKEAETKSGIGFDSNILLVVILFGFFLLMFLVLFVYLIFYRDKTLYELQNQYRKEIRRQEELIREKEEASYRKIKNGFERKEYKKEIEKVKKQRLKALKEIQKKRIKEYRKIKKKGKKAGFKEQIEKWKAQGYDISVLEKKYKLPNISQIRKKVNKWKKKGYDTSVLEKKLK